MKDCGLQYEIFVRKAFGYSERSQSIERGSDPAELALAGLFTEKNLAKIKVAVAYSIIVFTNKAMEILNAEELDLDTSDKEITRFRTLLESTISATELKLISNIINDVNNSIIDKYLT